RSFLCDGIPGEQCPFRRKLVRSSSHRRQPRRDGGRRRNRCVRPPHLLFRTLGCRYVHERVRHQNGGHVHVLQFHHSVAHRHSSPLGRVLRIRLRRHPITRNHALVVDCPRVPDLGAARQH